jgi:hypothetical protein
MEKFPPGNIINVKYQIIDLKSKERKKIYKRISWDKSCLYVKVILINSRVPAFEASKFMITNGEYLEFVESGGYDDEKFWTEEGWKWKEYRQSKHPVFWICNHGKEYRQSSGSVNTVRGPSGVL